MIGELVSYLLKQSAMLEVEGIKAKTHHMVDGFFDTVETHANRIVSVTVADVFMRLEDMKEKLMKELTYALMVLIGVFLFCFGLGAAIDRIVMFPGAGYMLIGMVLIVAAYIHMLKNR